jgi:uncharacterized protein YecT (DUF1311 family)
MTRPSGQTPAKPHKYPGADEKEDARLNADYGQATAVPYLAVGAAALVALAAFLAQRRWLWRRTHRRLPSGHQPFGGGMPRYRRQ